MNKNYLKKKSILNSLRKMTYLQLEITIIYEELNQTDKDTLDLQETDKNFKLIEKIIKIIMRDKEIIKIILIL